MSNYRTILERREHLHSEVASMGHQNKELEKELESKLKQKINDQLVFPPRDMISQHRMVPASKRATLD